MVPSTAVYIISIIPIASGVKDYPLPETTLKYVNSRGGEKVLGRGQEGE